MHWAVPACAPGAGTAGRNLRETNVSATRVSEEALSTSPANTSNRALSATSAQSCLVGKLTRVGTSVVNLPMLARRSLVAGAERLRTRASAALRKPSVPGTACSCVRCDRERRQERRLGDQWQRDDHHVLLVLRFATREQRYRKAQSQLCQHALQRDSTALGREKHKARRLAAALRESGVLQTGCATTAVHCRHKR